MSKPTLAGGKASAAASPLISSGQHAPIPVLLDNPPEADDRVIIVWVVVAMVTQDLHPCVSIKY